MNEQYPIPNQTSSSDAKLATLSVSELFDYEDPNWSDEDWSEAVKAEVDRRANAAGLSRSAFIISAIEEEKQKAQESPTANKTSSMPLIDEDDVLEIAFEVVNGLLGERNMNAEDAFSAAYRAGELIRQRVACRLKPSPQA